MYSSLPPSTVSAECDCKPCTVGNSQCPTLNCAAHIRKHWLALCNYCHSASIKLAPANSTIRCTFRAYAMAAGHCHSSFAPRHRSLEPPKATCLLDTGGWSGLLPLVTRSLVTWPRSAAGEDTLKCACRWHRQQTSRRLVFSACAGNSQPMGGKEDAGRPAHCTPLVVQRAHARRRNGGLAGCTVQPTKLAVQQ